MEPIAVISLIIGIFNIILGILLINRYRQNKKVNRSPMLLIPFLFAFIFIIGAITGYIWIIILSLFIIYIISLIYSKYTSIKYPEMKKKQEEAREKSQEIYKKHPLIYKLLRISRYMMYIMLACAIFLTAFIIIVVLFNVTF